MNTFAERVKEGRKQAGLSQQQLAKISGLAQATISDIETGRNESSRDVVALARALTVKAEWLVTGLGEKQTDAKSHVSRQHQGASDSHLQLVERIHARLGHLGWGWADLARAMGLTEQRVNNWRTRGIPARELRNVELALTLPRYALDVVEAQTAEIAVNAAGNAALGPDESELLKVWAYLLPAEKESVMEQMRPMAAHNKAVLEHYRESKSHRNLSETF